MNSEKTKKGIAKTLTEVIEDGEIVISELNKEDAYGHAAGTPTEDWVIKTLNENGYKAYYPNEFGMLVLEIQEKTREDLLGRTWWSALLLCKSQLRAFKSKGTFGRWQQEAADIVIFYGDDIVKDYNKIILINVKSHSISRKSRAPNIMSVLRIMEFGEFILREREDLLDKVELIFVGVYYDGTKNGGIVRQIAVKDLFKLDASKIAQINFDAALQLQWHVKDMVEIEQTKKEFIRSLASEVITKWKRFRINRDTHLEALKSSIDERTKEAS